VLSLRCCAAQFIFHGRNVVRIGIDAFAASGQEARACAVIKWTVAFGVLLKLHLREDTKREALERELGAWLSSAEISMLAASRHKPNAALQVISRLARAAPQAERTQLEVCVAAFSETLGRCERISRVPIPLSYTRHTSRFLIAWLILLPFGCWTAMGWDALLFAPLTAFLLFGVDQIGVDLENPFSVLPLDVLANKLKLDAADMVAQSADVAKLAAAAADEAGLAPAWRTAGGAAAAASRAAAAKSLATPQNPNSLSW
jgi:predicted membrane chloride channel (bestrophin family)